MRQSRTFGGPNKEYLRSKKAIGSKLITCLEVLGDSPVAPYIVIVASGLVPHAIKVIEVRLVSQE